MPRRVAGKPPLIASCVLLLGLVSCNSSPTAPTPVLQTPNFTGTLEPGGVDFKTFVIAYTFSATDLSVTINSLATVADATPVTGITMGVGFGVVSGTTCVMQIFNPEAPLAQELFVPNGANAGSYCVQIFDCQPGTDTCDPRLTEPVTYSMTVRHY